MKEHSAKKWFCKCIITTVIFLALIAGIMIVVDPYFHYHKPLSFLSYRLYEERYINDGIARNFDYDAIITGTSMSQNFKPSEFDALFGTKSVKLPFPGAGYQEIAENLERALSNNDSVHTVLLVLDYNGLLRSYDWRQYEEYPTYLYDNNPFNDAPYLFNKSILYHGLLPVFAMTAAGETGTTMDEYSSQDRETGLSVIMQSYDRENLNTDVPKDFGKTEADAVTKTITENVINIVTAYPDVTFYVMYPPYSICYWDGQYLRGTVLRQIAAEEVATKLLLECPNVKLYNFFDQYDVVCNPDYYYDDGHYNQEISSRILTWISEGTGLVTKENYQEKLAAERDFYTDFDYEYIYKWLNN